ncbi:hypothetical protein BHE74_00035957 [Ensete ventricosum]|nr:hypothetical protein BHE74_00035957 [Ensete ventricosum]
MAWSPTCFRISSTRDRRGSDQITKIDRCTKWRLKEGLFSLSTYPLSPSEGIRSNNKAPIVSIIVIFMILSLPPQRWRPEAVRGSVVRLKHISLAKASTILSRFAANENAARRDVAAYVRRASAAFDELVGFRHEIRATRKRSELEKSLMDEGDEERNRKKRRKRGRDEQVDGEVVEDADFLDRDGNRSGGVGHSGRDVERKKKKARNEANEEERSKLSKEELGQIKDQKEHYNKKKKNKY